MKLILALSVVAILSTFTSCTGTKPITIVSNRDAKGHFIKPVCPQCQANAKLMATVYQCENGHVYGTAWSPKQ